MINIIVCLLDCPAGVCDIDGMKEETGKGLVLVDIPGLLEGAHDGVGMGLAFLRHVQRCKVLIHVVRGDSEDPIGDFMAINNEIELFNPKLANKTQVTYDNCTSTISRNRHH